MKNKQERRKRKNKILNNTDDLFKQLLNKNLINIRIVLNNLKLIKKKLYFLNI